MNTSILYDKSLSIQVRFCYVLLASFRGEIDVEKIAELMGLRKGAILMMIDELRKKEIITSSSMGDNSYMKINFINHSPDINSQQVVVNNPLRKPIPPNGWEEVQQFFFLNKRTEQEALSFYNYYEAVGWYSGNNPIMNWRAKALSWNQGKFPQQNSSPTTTTTNEQQANSSEKKQQDFWGREW